MSRLPDSRNPRSVLISLMRLSVTVYDRRSWQVMLHTPIFAFTWDQSYWQVNVDGAATGWQLSFWPRGLEVPGSYLYRWNWEHHWDWAYYEYEGLSS